MTIPLLDFVIALGLLIAALFFIDGNASLYCSFAGGFFGWGAARPMIFGGHVLGYPR